MFSSHNEKSKINQDIIKRKSKIFGFNDIKNRVKSAFEVTFNPKRKKVSYAW